MELAALTSSRLIFDALPGTSRDAVLHASAERMARELGAGGGAELARRLIEREQLGSTALGKGVAIPHCKLDQLADVVLAIARLATPVDFAAPDGQPVDVLFLVLSPAATPAAHLRALGLISRWLKEAANLTQLRAARSPEAILELLAARGVGAR